MNMAAVLKQRFPWLGTADGSEIPYPSGADAIDALEQFYREQQDRPVPNIVNGELVCPCGHVERPQLSEEGYVVTHDLRKVEGNEITAEGWDGRSNSISESGDSYFLECRNCCKQYSLPEGMEVNWV